MARKPYPSDLTNTQWKLVARHIPPVKATVPGRTSGPGLTSPGPQSFRDRGQTVEVGVALAARPPGG